MDTERFDPNSGLYFEFTPGLGSVDSDVWIGRAEDLIPPAILERALTDTNRQTLHLGSLAADLPFYLVSVDVFPTWLDIEQDSATVPFEIIGTLDFVTAGHIVVVELETLNLLGGLPAVASLTQGVAAGLGAGESELNIWSERAVTYLWIDNCLRVVLPFGFEVH